MTMILLYYTPPMAIYIPQPCSGLPYNVMAENQSGLTRIFPRTNLGILYVFQKLRMIHIVGNFTPFPLRYVCHFRQFLIFNMYTIVLDSSIIIVPLSFPRWNTWDTVGRFQLRSLMIANCDFSLNSQLFERNV